MLFLLGNVKVVEFYLVGGMDVSFFLSFLFVTNKCYKTNKQTEGEGERQKKGNQSVVFGECVCLYVTLLKKV